MIAEFLLWVGKNIHHSLLAEMLDESKIREDLLDLGLRLESGEMGEESYLEQEELLINRLREVRRLRSELEETENG